MIDIKFCVHNFMITIAVHFFVFIISSTGVSSDVSFIRELLRSGE